MIHDQMILILCEFYFTNINTMDISNIILLLISQVVSTKTRILELVGLRKINI